jgi:hypothetical protein
VKVTDREAPGVGAHLRLGWRGLEVKWVACFGLGPSQVLPFSFLFFFFVLFYPLFPNSKLQTKFKLCGTVVLGAFGLRRSSKTGFNNISGV